MIEVLVIVAMMAVVITTAACLLWLVDRLRYRPLSSEERVKRQQDHERRLREPDWAFVAAEFGGQIPGGVASLYGDTRLLLNSPATVSEEIDIAEFVPADDNAFDPEQWFNPAANAFVFAVTRFGDPFFVRTSEVAAGLPVYLHFHDGGDTKQVTPTLEEFIRQVRSVRNREDG